MYAYLLGIFDLILRFVKQVQLPVGLRAAV